MKLTFGRSFRHDLKRPLFWLGFVLPVCFVAGVTGASIPTQWPLLSVVLSVMLIFSPYKLGGKINMTSWFGLAFLAYACLSVTWSPNPVFAVYGLWQVAIWGLAFWLGSTSPSLSPLWRGLAVGLGISSMVAVAQALGWDGVPSRDHPAGLLYSGPLQGAVIALVTVALVCDRAWPYIPAMLPGLWLAHSRGGWLALVVGLGARAHWSLPLLATGAAAALALSDIGRSDSLRLQEWSIAAHGLTLSGFGAGAFGQVIYRTPAAVVHPEFVHNDYLQLAFEYGLGSLFLFPIMAAALANTGARTWPVFAAFCTLGLFYFPLYTAPLAFTGAVAAGHILRRHGGVQLSGCYSRSDLMAWANRTWREAFPVPPRNPPETIGAVDVAR